MHNIAYLSTMLKGEYKTGCPLVFVTIPKEQEANLMTPELKEMVPLNKCNEYVVFQ